MRSALVVSLILGLAFLFTRPIFSTRWALFGFRQFFLSGVELLLLGYAIGPRGIDLLPPVVIDSLEPVLHLAVGWAGLVFGLQFNRRAVGMYRLRRWGMAFLQALFSGLLCAGAGWLLVARLLPDSDLVTLQRTALLIGVCGAGTAPSSIHYFSRLFRIRGRVNRLLKFVVAVDGIPAVVLLGIFSSLYHVTAGDGTAWGWLVAGTFLGLVLGGVLAALVALEFSRDELMLFVLGVVVLAGGLAHHLQLSALWVTFLMGVVVANTAWHRDEVYKVVTYAEQPIYLAMVVLTGALLDFSDPRVFLLGAVLVGVRLVGKLIGNVPWRWLGSEPETRTPLLGLALLSQGGWAIVLAMDLDLLYRADLARAAATDLVLSAVLFGVMVNELASPLFLRVLFPVGHPERRTETAETADAAETKGRS